MYFNKLNAAHFEQVSILLDSAALMVKAINDAGNNGYELIADNDDQEVEQYRALIQGFRYPYENSLTAICKGIQKRLDMQHQAILQQLEHNSFGAVQVSEYLKNYDECKAVLKAWENKIESAGTTFYFTTSSVHASFVALEQTYHEQLKSNCMIKEDS